MQHSDHLFGLASLDFIYPTTDSHTFMHHCPISLQPFDILFDCRLQLGKRLEVKGAAQHAGTSMLRNEFQGITVGEGEHSCYLFSR